MKPAIKRTIIITSAALAAVLVAVLVLCLVTIKPIDRLGGYDNIYVLESYNQRFQKKAEVLNDKVLEKGLDTIKFTVMRSLLEKQADYKVKPVIEKDEDDNDMHRKFSAEDFSNFRPVNGEFMIELYYNATRTSENFLDENGKQIHYNKIIMIISATEDVIYDVRLYPYLQSNMDGGVEWDEPDENGRVARWAYNVYEFTAKMNTYDFYEILKDYYEPASGGTVA